MAKPKPDLTDIFAKTESAQQAPPPDNSDLDQGRILSSGVGVTEGELAAINSIAAQLGVKRNAVMRFALRWFIMRYRAGQVDLSPFVIEPETPAKKLKMP